MIRLLEGTPEDIGESFKVFEDVRSYVFPDNAPFSDTGTFDRYLTTHNAFPIFTRFEDGAFSSIFFITHLTPGEQCNFNGYMHPDFRVPSISTKIAKHALWWYIKMFKLKRVCAFIRCDNRLARLGACRLGFKKVATIGKFCEHNQVPTDYFMYVFEVMDNDS